MYNRTIPEYLGAKGFETEKLARISVADEMGLRISIFFRLEKEMDIDPLMER